MNFSVSIVIPTYKRKSSLERLLKSLESKKNNFLEILVVVQGEGKKNMSKIGRISYIYVKKPSMTRARNVGAQKAKGNLLLFLDDDTVVRPYLVQNHANSFQDAQVGATLGRVITAGQPIESDNRKVGRVGLLGNVSGGFSSTIYQETDTVIGCNMCWRKDVWEKLHGVDEQFTGNALREETDLSLRAKQLGYKIIFEPKAVVEHHRAETGGARKSEGRLQWYFDFFSNETYFFLKHKPKILLPLFWLTKIEWVLRCMLGFGREVSVRSFSLPFAGAIDGLKKYRNL